MKEQFDNSNINDGNQRISMPANTPKGKIPFGKCIIFIVLLGFIGGYIFLVLKGTNERTNAITKEEWNEILYANFGINEYIPHDDEIATGRYAALTSISLLGDDRLSHMTSKDVTDEDILVKMAIECGIVSEDQLESEMSEKEAELIAKKAVEIYGSADYFPEYDESVLNSDVLETNDWTFSVEGEDYTNVTVNTGDDTPEEGQILIINSEDNVACAAKIVSCDGEEGNYHMQLEAVNDLAEVYDVLHYSGVSDFSQYKDANDSGTIGEVGKIENQDVLHGVKDVFSPMKVYAADPTIIKCEPDRITTTDIKAEITAESGEGLKAVLTANGKEIVKKEGIFKSKDEEESGYISFGGSISGSVELQDFCVVSSAYIDLKHLNSPENYANVMISSNVIFNLDIQGSVEGKFPLGTVHVPLVEAVFVVVPVEMIAVDITPYLVVGVNGEVEITYTINNISTGACVNTSGVTLVPLTHDKPELELNIQVEAYTGIDTVASIKALMVEWEPIIDPSITVKAVINAKKIKNKEGYEKYPECWDIKALAPIIDLALMDSEDSAVYKFLDFIDVSYNNEISLISEEQAFVLLERHLEWDLNKKISIIEGDEKKCTHIKKSTIKKKIEKKVDDKIEDAEEKAMDRLEEWLNNLLMETCGGCC